MSLVVALPGFVKETGLSKKNLLNDKSRDHEVTHCFAGTRSS